MQQRLWGRVSFKMEDICVPLRVRFNVFTYCIVIHKPIELLLFMASLKNVLFSINTKETLQKKEKMRR